MTEELKQRGGREDPVAGTLGHRTDRVVFGVTAAITLAFVIWGWAATDSLEDVSTSMLGGLIHNGGWAFMLAASCFVVFALWLAMSRYGRIHLGAEGEEPEFKTVSWVAMMFSAGMGIGLMFYGVSEPLSHYTTPPPGTNPANSGERMETAMATTLFHWTLHPWAIYAVVGLGIAYSTFRKRRRQTISAVFTPLIGEKHANGTAGRVIDILAIIATVFGSAASLGLGALQIGSGFQELNWMDDVSTGLLVTIIAVLTLAFVLSAVSGIERGIQWLSNTNMVLALILAVFVFIAGPTIIVLDLLPTSVFSYLGDLPQLAGRTEASGGKGVADWLGSWTVFYWAWWISWTPFVGMFIARISRGRTIRQFVTGVLLVPSVVSVIWFGIFGGAAFDVQQKADEAGQPGLMTVTDGVASIDFDGALFNLVKNLPMPGWLTAAVIVLAMVLVAIFFITGADSASLIMSSLSSNGASDPKRGLVIFWGALTGAVAAVMLLAGGDEPSEALSGLQRITIVAALPFVVVMLLLCFALAKDLRRDPLSLRRRLADSVVERAIRTGVEQHGGVQFDLVTRHEHSEKCAEGESCPGTGSNTVSSTEASKN
jgi:choline/carnitine/betaine transport